MIDSRDVFLFALRALAGHRLRSVLSLLGVAIGVGAVVALTALGEGARRYVAEQFTSLGSNVLIVFPGRTETTGGVPGVGGAPHDLTLDDSAAIARALAGEGPVVPIAMGTESVAHGDRRRQVAVVGATHDFLAVRHLRMGRGEYLPPGEIERGEAVAVLGHKAAVELFRETNPLGQIVRIGGWRMRVIGVTAPRGVQLGLDLDDVVFVPVATAMRIFDRSSLFRVFVQMRSVSSLPAGCGRIIDLLAERHGERDVTCMTQEAVVGAVSSILTAVTLALAAIAAVSLLVAGIGIMNVMLVSVSERTREVGVLKALGAGRSQVMAVFLAEAALLSTVGGLVGLSGGWGAVLIVVGLYPAFPANPPAWAVAAALGLALGVGVVFGVLPARRATRLDPVAALSGR
jgi:putative ABC transport system permease protein